jgi:hypothetical protein
MLGTWNIEKFRGVTFGPVFGGDNSSVHTDSKDIWECGKVATSVPLSKFKAESQRI